MSLAFLGRGRRTDSWVAALTHVAGAAIGGGITGLLFGGIGSFLPHQLRWEITAAIVLASAGLAVFAKGSLGLAKQVPRTWGRMPAPLTLFLWGALLGGGTFLLIPYSSQLVIWGSEIATGPFVGVAIGIGFGLGRGVPAVSPLLLGGTAAKIGGMMDLLPALHARARYANMALNALAVPVLFVVSRSF
jgi:hypothetical protein